MIKRISFLLALLTLISILSCDQKKETVRTDPELLREYVSGHMPDAIRPADQIRVRFVQPAVIPEKAGTEVETKAWSIHPFIEGRAVWEDPNTFLFTPARYFHPGKDYTLTFNPGEVIPGNAQFAPRLVFPFSVLPANMQIEFGGIQPARNAGEMQLSGTLYAGIPADERKVEKTFSIKYGPSTPVVAWEHLPDKRTHLFTISGIRQSEGPEVLEISWSESVVESKEKGMHRVTIPARDAFVITQVDVVQAGGKQVRILFSDLLDPSQQINGLVRIPDAEDPVRLERDGNELTVYTGERLNGSFELIVEGAIKSRGGRLLGTAKNYHLSFEDMLPRLKLVGRGVIVPHTDQVIFPFEAINIRAVTVEIFQLFESNVLQFLQYQDLHRTWGMEPVGRIIAQEYVPLEITGDDRNQWKHIGLDLRKYTSLSPGSIYQVRVGFERKDVIYACDNEPANNEMDRSSGDGFETIMRYPWDYPGYRYGQSENPCFPAYYSEENFIQRNILASNLGLVAKAGEKGNMQITVLDLRTTDPVPDAEVALYDFQQQQIGTAHTDDAGKCAIPQQRKPSFVIASRGAEKGYLKLGDASARQMGEFDVSGVQPLAGMKGFLYGERDVWRPGDTVFLNFILDEAGATGINHPVTCTLINPRGQELYTSTISESIGPIYPFHFDTRNEDLTGNWRAEVQVGGATFSKVIKLETIRPNRLKIRIDADEEIGAYAGSPVLGLRSNWLHGAPAGGLDAKVEMQLIRNKAWDGGASGYVFQDPTRMTDSRINTVYEGALDPDGEAKVSLREVRAEDLPGPMIASFKTRVFEPGGAFSSDQFRVPWHPYESYVGVKLPESRWGSKQLELDQENQVEIRSITHDGSGTANRTLTVGLYQAEWRWWWDRTNRSLAQFNSSMHTGSFIQDTILTDKSGKATYTITPKQYGAYLVRVCDAESGHCTGDFYYAGELWNENEDRHAAVKLVFSSDREKYSIGDFATLHIPSAPGSTVLVSLENQEGVLTEGRIMAISTQTDYSFQVTGEMMPNIYAHVSLLQPHAGHANDLPVRMYGVIPVMVEDPERVLLPSLEMPDELSPNKPFSVSVSERDGRPMAYTLAIVDEGLLDLTRFRTPDPGGHFFAREALGIRTWDVYDYVLGNYGSQVDRIISIGGDGAGPQIQDLEEVNRFKPVVLHLGPFYLKPGESAKHDLVMPNYVGSVRAMVVAAGSGKYGSAEKTVAVKQPLMLLPTLPRVLSPGEQIIVPVNVFAMDPRVKKVDIRCDVNDQLEILGTSQKELVFDRPGDQLIHFEILVREQIGKGEVRFTAESGRYGASAKTEIEILNPNPVISEVTDYVIPPGGMWDPLLDPVGMEGTREAVLELYRIVPFNLDVRLRYLIRYPYGCLEQTTSSVFPQLYVESLIELDQNQKNLIRSNVQAAIRKIRNFYHHGGGFTYWQGGSEVNDWTNSYAGHFLIEARKAGYYVPADMLEHWLSYQRNAARRFGQGESDFHAMLDQAYRLYTMALHSTAAYGEMNRMRNMPILPNAARLLLAGAYELTGQHEVAMDLVRKGGLSIEAYTSTGRTYGSDLRDRALLVESLSLMDQRSEAAPVVRKIVEDLGSGSWYSTQSTAFALKAIAGFLDGDKGGEMQFAVQMGDGQEEQVHHGKPVYRTELESPEIGKYRFTVQNTGKAELFARVVRRGQPAGPVTLKRNNHLNMQVRYLTMDGKELNVSTLRQGTDFIAEITVGNPGTRAASIEELALAQVFPSGWEILNQRMDVFADALKSDAFDYQDIRDDRVNTFFDLDNRNTAVFRVGLNATYAGRFLMPAQQCEAMYDHSISAVRPGRWVEVFADQQIAGTN